MFSYEEIKETIDTLVEMAKESEIEGDLLNAKFYRDEAFRLAETNSNINPMDKQ